MKSSHEIFGGAVKKPGFIDDMLKAGIFKTPFFRPGFLEKVNKYLAVFLSALLIYLLADIIIFRSSSAAKRIISRLSNGKTGAGHPLSMPAADAKDYSYYSSVISGKEVFAKSAPAASDEVPEGPPDISLVGIIVGARPQAIIENNKTNMVYYVYQGDEFDDFSVEEVSEYKAVLSYKGERIELAL